MHRRRMRHPSFWARPLGVIEQLDSRFTKMTTLYFDCFAGASGDMILGALVGAGVDPQALRDQLALLDVTGFSVEFEKVDRGGLSLGVQMPGKAGENEHGQWRA